MEPDEVKPHHARKLLLSLKIILGLIAVYFTLAIFNDLHLLLSSESSLPKYQAFLSLVFGLLGFVGVAGLFSLQFDPNQWISSHPAISWLRRWWRMGSLSLFLVMGYFSVDWVVPYIPFIENDFARFVLILLIAPFAQVVGGIISAVSMSTVIGFALMGVVGWPISMFLKIVEFERLFTAYKQSKTGLISYLVRFAHWLTETEAPPQAPDDSKGARFATPEETDAIINKGYKARYGTVFGYVGNRSPLLIHTEKHVLIMASTRSGKGVSLIIPHLLRYHGSAFVLDPKGENARATGRQRSQLNEKVLYLDQFGISGKPQSRFNPLSRFTPENMETESKALAAALIITDQSSAERDHWKVSAQQLLAALILHVFTVPDIPPEEKDLITTRYILLRFARNALEDMKNHSTAADGLLSSLAKSFLDTPEKELGSIISTAQRETEILDNPFIAACLSASGSGKAVNFADWKKGTMTVFLCLSAPKFPVFNRWLRLVLTSALDEMTNTLQPPPLPVCFMLDELATLGHLTAVENAVGLAAGYGVQLFTIFQDIAQMKDLYRGRWASFIGNAGVCALFNLDDYDTAKYWSNSLGGHLVQTANQQADLYGYFERQTLGETMRPLRSPEEIMLQYADDKMLVLPQGGHPVESERVAYYDDPNLVGLWDDPRGQVP
ncbi:MAG: type IV secretory system conjugative DNA transfer family protein [Nitrospirae bacterium]|nr:type IV secretory system conjugative DNA transfer family protein [Nitrospirota bacterium]